MFFVAIVFWTMGALVVYVYAGYPLLLRSLVALGGGRDRRVDSSEPTVTLLISAYNEGAVIAAKIDNSLALDYPQDRLDIVVISDASEDDTDEIVRGYGGRNVRLLRMRERGGKTLGLNAAVAEAKGEIVVFSDANAMYRPEAIRALVRNFADPAVGAVVGESTYTDQATESDKSESWYWRYETAIKLLESRVGSTVGGDGAIYAIRRALYEPMTADALSDFVNPLQIVARGLRCVYEPEAISVEQAAGTFMKEFKRKVRIVNRAWRATLRMRRLLNPFHYGRFALQLISHKLLRWFVPVFLLAAFVANIALIRESVVYEATLVLQLVFYGLASAGYVMHARRDLPFVVYVPFYFCLVNIASLRGILQVHRGKTYTIWSTARQ
jgi:cellulose synthase/poly-beta-1,6-N-acetylglucosamine synthase-like glycosyltransferase